MTTDQIINAVCAAFGVTRTELRNRRKHRQVADARKTAAYFLRTVGNKDHAAINQLLNQRSSWASWAVWRCHDLANADKAYAAKCVGIYNNLKGGVTA